MIAPSSLPRLIHQTTRRPLTLVEHELTFAPSGVVIDAMKELEASGLMGRGGAGFPTHRKVALLRTQRSRTKYVVVNAMEGEPASHKDRSLIAANPHLVLDGAEALAAMIGAKHIAVCVAREFSTTINHMERAIHERQRRSQRGPVVELHTPPGRYVAGEESALVHWLDDNQCLPQYRPNRPNVLHIGQGAVLLDNAETCANVGLIARYGAEWFRSLGTSAHPGSLLVSVTGAVLHPTVMEVAAGTPIRQILEAAKADSDPQALLLGGYSGEWISARDIDLPFDNAALKTVNASVGAGIIFVLPQSGCGIGEIHNIVRWMANESARQCGPCAFGLPSMADDVGLLLSGSKDASAALRRLNEQATQIDGRGACHHPDGVVRFVRSSLRVFDDDIRAHASGRPCAGARGPRFATVPRLERGDELVWE